MLVLRARLNYNATDKAAMEHIHFVGARRIGLVAPGFIGY